VARMKANATLKNEEQRRLRRRPLHEPSKVFS
jgi:hypothetical protein